MTKTPFKFLSNETNKGAAILALGAATAGSAIATAKFAAIFPSGDRDTLTIGSIVLEAVDLTAVGAICPALNDTDTSSAVTIPSHGRVVGDYISVDNEVMLVSAVADADNLTLLRAQATTTIAVHASIAIQQAEVPPLTAGAITVPTVPGDPNQMYGVWADAIDVSADGYTAMTDGTTLVYILATASGVNTSALAVSPTLGTVSANMSGGSPQVIPQMRMVEAYPTGDDVMAGLMVYCPIVPVLAICIAQPIAGGASRVCDVTIQYNAMGPNVIKVLSDGMSVTWDQNDKCTFLVWGAPIELDAGDNAVV